MGRARPDPWLLATLAVSACLGLYQLRWGLPAGEHSWAVDGLEPLTVFGILSASFRKWNSGWFYFKYPLAYPLSLGATFAPYVGYLFLTGQWGRPTSASPHGFARPEEALFLLAFLGRCLSVVFTLGTVAAAYGICRRLSGSQAAGLGAWLVATCYPVVYYAHTMNVDASYLFWLFFALYCAIVASDTDRGLPWWGFGLAAAMAVSTKEQAFGFLLPLPILALASRARVHGIARACWSRAALLMTVAAIGTAVIVNNALFNPLGVVARLAFLLGVPLKPVDVPLKPVAFAWFKGAQEWIHLDQLRDGLSSALGGPLALVAIAAMVTVWRVRRTGVWLVVPGLAYYYLSLRGQELITMRYSLPLAVLACLLAAVLLGELRASAQSGAARTVALSATLIIALLSLARGIELDLLLRNDSRYEAEAWMKAHLPAGSRGEISQGEIYQKATYLPRFPKHVSVTFVPIHERSMVAVEQRHPDFIVLSSASRKSISHVWNPDWRTTGMLLVRAPEAQRFLDALERETLAYRRVVVFRQEPWLLRPRITGLCPEITIYRREQGAGERPSGDAGTMQRTPPESRIPNPPTTQRQA